jgi:uncharacterized protein (DUF885 family)
MRKKIFFLFLIIVAKSCLLFSNKGFDQYTTEFCNGIQQLNLPSLTYDYRDYFSTITTEEKLEIQEDFFKTQYIKLSAFTIPELAFKDQLIAEHILYEINFNLDRISLEKNWVRNGRLIPSGGLYKLENSRNWYRFFIQKFTGLALDPENLMKFGKEEVEKVKKEINRLQSELGFSNTIKMYDHLHSDQFYITDKSEIIAQFTQTDSIIRANLIHFIGNIPVDPIYPLEWPDANAYTPPGMYLNSSQNAYGKDVFLYNFYGKKYNRRCIDWIFIHEGIPGHHLQAAFREQSKPDSVQSIFTYPGNFEGWACYVEYEGKALGVFTDKYKELGKWEWDLIRSARVVMEVGIHHYGWDKQQALDYWKENIYGQDEIAEREITRITNWPGQALAYKVGASTIMDLKNETKQLYGSKYDEVKFHQCYLSFGMRPLELIRNNFQKLYTKL